MATYDLEEQEQIDNLKAWWKLYGNLVTSALLAVAVAAAGWQGWNWYQRNQAAQASVIFNALQQAVYARDTQKIKVTAGELAEKFGSTTYAPLGALISARALLDAGDVKTAHTQLSWAVSHGDNEVRDLARLRLAAVMLDENTPDEALKQLDATPAPAFAARYAEMRGDILAIQGKKAEARQAYKQAVDKLTGEAVGNDSRPLTPYRDIVQQKLDSLGENG
ncbi:MAG: hypothetical protein RIR00_474 [Pseudomonadota bacterium]